MSTVKYTNDDTKRRLNNENIFLKRKLGLVLF